MKKPSKVQGIVAIVTGASSGIGEATARELASHGAKVVLVARRAERLQRLADEIQVQGGAALAVPADLTEVNQIYNLIHTTLSTYGRIDVLANIAGMGHYDWFEEFTAENLRQQYEVNLLGMAELIRQVLPIMKSQRSGHIINMSSYASRISVPPLTVYASTKYAVEGLTDGLRRELAPWGIYVSRVHPSGVPGTEFNQLAAENGGIQYRSVPIGKVSRQQVARAIRRLVEKPRPAVFLSRLYDVPVLLNRLAPGLVDAFFTLWVKRKRKDELQRYPKARAVNYKRMPLALPVGLLVTASILALRAGKNRGGMFRQFRFRKG